MLCVESSRFGLLMFQSEFYKALNVEDDEKFHVPVKQMKKDTSIRSLQDACELLCTIRFWGVDLTTVNSLKQVDWIYQTAAAEGHLTCLSLLDEQPQLSLKVIGLFSYQLASLAAGNGHLECLKFFHQRGVTLRCGVEPAAANGHIACLVFIVQNCPVDLGIGQKGARAYAAAVRSDHFNCGKLLRESGYPWTEEVSFEAAKRGSLEVLQYYNEQGGEWTYLTCGVSGVSEVSARARLCALAS